jgi:hypothetical protein
MEKKSEQLNGKIKLKGQIALHEYERKPREINSLENNFYC